MNNSAALQSDAALATKNIRNVSFDGALYKSNLTIYMHGIVRCGIQHSQIY